MVAREQSLQVDVAGKLGREAIDPDAAGSGMQHSGRGDAAGQGVEQVLDRVRALVAVPETAGARRPYFPPFLPRRNSRILSRISRPAPIVMAESAMLNAGKYHCW